MDYLEIFLNYLIIPILGTITGFIAVLINAKAQEIKQGIINKKNESDCIREETALSIAKALIEQAEMTLVSVVTSTNQTYVDELKRTGEFTKESQKEAFRLSFESAQKVLGEGMRAAIEEIHGDVSDWIEMEIESIIKAMKEGLVNDLQDNDEQEGNYAPSQ